MEAIDEIAGWKKWKVLLPQAWASSVVTSLHLVIGQIIAYSGIVVPQLMEEQNSTIVSDYSLHITESDSAWIASAPLFSGLAASVLAGVFIDHFGRLRTLQLAGIPGVIGLVLIATATNVHMIIWGRIIIGICFMFLSNPAAVYVSEISRPDVRGSFLTLMEIFMSIGMLCIYLKGWVMNWRLIAWLTNFYLIVPIIVTFSIPESPAWLVSNNRLSKARKSLTWFYKYNTNRCNFVEKELTNIQLEQELKNTEEQFNWKEHLKLFFLPTFYKPFLILSALFFFQQFSGTFAIIFNCIIFFKEIGTDIDPYLASIYISGMKVVMSLITMVLMNKCNRRTLLMSSAGGMAFCMFFSGYFTKCIQEGTFSHTWVPLFCILLYVIFSSIGLNSVPFMITGELFPLKIRGMSYSLVITATVRLHSLQMEAIDESTGWKKWKVLLPQALACSVVTSLHLVIGQIIAYSGIVVPQLMEEQNSTIVSNYSIHITESDSAWIASAPLFSGLVASVLAGVFIDNFGRIRTLQIAGIPGVIGLVLIATATNVHMIIWGRIIIGICFMFLSNPTAVYVSEISRPDVRGSFLSLMQIFMSIGMVCIYLTGWVLNWRVIAWLTNFYLIVPIILTFCIPESPAWLISKNHISKAKKSLTWFYKYNTNSWNLVEKELTNIQLEQELKQTEEQFNWKEHLKLFLLPTFYKPFLILSAIFFFQQFSGTFAIIFNCVIFFKEIGTDIDPYLASIYISGMKVVMSLVTMVLMKKFNRRTLLLSSAGGMTFCMFLSGFFTKWIQEGTYSYTWVPLFCILLYIIFSSMGLNSVPFMMTGELFPLKIRGISYSLVIAVVNVMTFSVLQCYFPLYHLFGGSSGLQFFFGIMSLGALIVIYMFLPETHNFKLIEIEEHFLKYTVYLPMREVSERSL
ncbi:hypothetical protein FQA39_LY16886 [Lamprigera yunnana]|nr:hypothetical protein FQA39_LY16886 [Lamprigera yunnana]